MAERKKVSKASVHYRVGAGQRKCVNCAMYHAGTCDLVMGKIASGAVCDKWVKRG